MLEKIINKYWSKRETRLADEARFDIDNIINNLYDETKIYLVGWYSPHQIRYLSKNDLKDFLCEFDKYIIETRKKLESRAK